MSQFFKEVKGIELGELGEVISEGRHPVVPQDGPLRWYDTYFTCVNRGCRSPTYCKVKGIPYCMKHALSILNEMLIELGVAA